MPALPAQGPRFETQRQRETFQSILRGALAAITDSKWPRHGLLMTTKRLYLHNVSE